MTFSPCSVVVVRLRSGSRAACALVLTLGLIGGFARDTSGALTLAPIAHADDELDDGDVFLGVVGRSAIVGATTTMFLGIGAGAGFGFAYLACPSLQCPRFHPGARPSPDAPIDPVMLAAGSLMGAALIGGFGAYLSGAIVAVAFN